MNFAFSNPFRPAAPAAPRTTPGDLVARARAGEVTLIDVRDHREVAQTGKARGALHIPLFQITRKADPRHPEFDTRLSPQEPVAIYCATGARSEMARRALVSLGYSEVHNLGGLGHWRAAGGGIEA